MRIIAIRNSEELMCWEVLDNCNGRKHFLSVNSAKLLAFRWPFVAYCTDSTKIAIAHVAYPDYVVHQTFDLGVE